MLHQQEVYAIMPSPGCRSCRGGNDSPFTMFFNAFELFQRVSGDYDEFLFREGHRELKSELG